MIPIIPFRKQLSICDSAGFRKETKFLSFSENPGLLPAFPTKAMQHDIENGSWNGITVSLCGKFNNGVCESGNELCKIIRGL
jgi:hypothetical protein